MSYRRYRRKPQASHADDWLMTYADMITLLVCFFAVFLVITMSKKATHSQETQSTRQIEDPKSSHFETPAQKAIAKFVKTVPVQEEDGSVTVPVITMPAPRVDYPVEEMPEEVGEESVTQVEPGTPRVVVAPPPVVALPETIEQAQKQAPAAVEEKGDRITTMEMSSGAFFDVGAANLNDAGKLLLKDVAAKIKSDEYKDYQVTIEGHTDDSPIKTAQFPSNWELSTARASAVVHFFLDQGIPAQRLRAAGYADSFPKAPNRDANNNAIPANQAQNRRVLIKLEKIEKETH